jgi:hypothetical protein
MSFQTLPLAGGIIRLSHLSLRYLCFLLLNLSSYFGPHFVDFKNASKSANS